MLEKQRSLGVLHARLRAVGGELFRAEYSGEINPNPSDACDIPDYHVGTSAEDVKIWVEQMAEGLGYERVVWDELPGYGIAALLRSFPPLHALSWARSNPGRDSPNRSRHRSEAAASSAHGLSPQATSATLLGWQWQPTPDRRESGGSELASSLRSSQ